MPKITHDRGMEPTDWEVCHLRLNPIPYLQLPENTDLVYLCGKTFNTMNTDKETGISLELYRDSRRKERYNFCDACLLLVMAHEVQNA